MSDSPSGFGRMRDDAIEQDSQDSLTRIARDYVPRFIPPVALLVVMWLARLVDWILPGDFNKLGLVSWQPTHLYGLVTSPLLHGGWGHLLANSVPFLVLGLLVAAGGARTFWWVTAVVALVSGAGAFFINTPGVLTVGASGLVFGYFGYVLVAGFFATGWVKKIAMWLVAIVVFAAYGMSMFSGIIAAGAHVSWQGHLFGLAGGVVAAWWPARQRKRALSAG